jgi:hypothetical protein
MRALLFVVLATQLIAAEPKPNFSGTWKLNIGKSDFGQSPAPKSVVSKIEHKDPEIKVHSETAGSQGTYSTEYKWITDGRENVNTIRGNEVHANVVWNGKALISNAKMTVNNITVSIIDQWTLSADGQNLTMTRTITGPQGTAEQKYVYEK